MIKFNDIKGLLAAVAASIVLTLSSANSVLALPGATSSSSILPIYKTQWGGAGPGNGQFSSPIGVDYDSPNGIAFDSEGNVYVADYISNSRIQKFSSDGTFIKAWGGPGVGDGLFDGPTDIAVDSNDNVYVTDIGRTGRHHVQKFTSEGQFITKWGMYGHEDGQLVTPQGIAIDKNDNVYVLSTGNDTVQKYTSDGTFITNWGSTGTTGNGTFNTPTGISVDDDGNVYVADSGSNMIQKFTSDGVFLAQFGSHGTSTGLFDAPYDVAVDRNGHIYVVEVDNNRVQIFNSDFTFIDTWGSFGTGDGQFDSPRQIAVDRKGGIYVSDDGNTRIQKFLHPQNLANLTAPGSSAGIKLTLPEGNHITNIASLADPNNDNGYDYPLGLVDFTVQSAVGGTTEVTLLFETNLKRNDVTVRKYNSITKTYTTMENVGVTETTVNGNPGLRLFYEITDGGSLDEDGAANGVIVDPVGLATTQTSPSADGGDNTPQNGSSGTIVPCAPDTGFGAFLSNPFSTMTVFTIGAAVLIGSSVIIRQYARNKAGILGSNK